MGIKACHQQITATKSIGANKRVAHMAQTGLEGAQAVANEMLSKVPDLASLHQIASSKVDFTELREMLGTSRN